MSVESNVVLAFFCFATLSDWLKKLTPLSQPIRRKTKTNRYLFACTRFPAGAQRKLQTTS